MYKFHEEKNQRETSFMKKKIRTQKAPRMKKMRMQRVS